MISSSFDIGFVLTETRSPTYRHNVWCVQVDDALDVRPGLVDGGVKHEACLVHTEVGCSLLHHLALHVDFDQTGSRDLVVKHSKWV